MNKIIEDRLKCEIRNSLEACTCMGRDAYGAYIEKHVTHLLEVIKKEVQP